MPFSTLILQTLRLLLLILALGLCRLAEILHARCNVAPGEVAGHLGASSPQVKKCIEESSGVANVELDEPSPSSSTKSIDASHEIESTEPCLPDPDSESGIIHVDIVEGYRKAVPGIDRVKDLEESKLPFTKLESASADIRPSTPLRNRDHGTYHDWDEYLRPYPGATPGRDSGYGSSTKSSPEPMAKQDLRTDCKKPRRVSNISSSCNLVHELLEIKRQKRVLKMLLRYHPAWRVGGISLSCFVLMGDLQTATSVQITVLDRQESTEIPLNEALSTRDLRRRTGLCVALHDTRRQKFITDIQKALGNSAPLEEIEALIYVWNRTTKAFENLGDVLASPQRHSQAGLRIGHCSERPHRGPSMTELTSWIRFVEATDIGEFYLRRMQAKGVELMEEASRYQSMSHGGL